MNATDIIDILGKIASIAGFVSLCLYFFLPVYTVIGFFATKKFPIAKKQHKYAIMIAARNESAVIGNLIDSISAQDYPSELVTVFVVADNCTDNTAEIARSHGAKVYEREDPEHRTKGYALEFLVDNIGRDYGIESFEAYFIFDADNLLERDYISRMNEAFDSGEKIVTSYRNTKNFDDGWIAASYGLHWLRCIRHEHRGRSSLGLATRIQGTGFMFASEVIKDGWHYVSFTEDRAFAADAVVSGYRISYCNLARFYDEQPTSLRIALRQRIRWAKGHLQAFAESGPKLFWHTVTGSNGRPDYPLKKCDSVPPTDDTAARIYEDVTKLLFDMLALPKKTLLSWGVYPFRLIVSVPVLILTFVAVILKWISTLADKVCVYFKNSEVLIAFLNSRFFRGIKTRFMSYDMFTITYPNSLVTFVVRILRFCCEFLLLYTASCASSGFMKVLGAFAMSFALRYVGKIFMGVYVFFMERRHIIYIPVYKKAFYCIMWPWFDIIGSISVFAALFLRVEWKPIPHNADIDINQLSHKR